MTSAGGTEVAQPDIGRKKLSARARAGLDVARASAALYVVAHHVIGSIPVPSYVDLAFSFGQEAVIVFFLLSGFVIFANERDRSGRPSGYFLRRARRIYPLVIVAMATSLLLWALGLIDEKLSLWSAFSTLLSLQDIAFLKPGVLSDPFLGNDPLWSLSYEVFFYAVFPLVMIGWRRSELATRHVVGFVAVVGYVSYLIVPNHFSLVVAYFLLWWAGAMLAKAYTDDKINFRAVRPEILWLSVLVCAASVGVMVIGFSGPGYFPFLMVRHFAFGLLLILLVLTPVRRAIAGACLIIALPTHHVAALSYGLYVLHYPLLVQSGAAATVWFIPALVGTVGLAYLSDTVLSRVLPKAPRG